MQLPAKKPRVYIAGPVTGIPDHNRPAFAKAAADLDAHGYEASNPLLLPPPQERTWENYMRVTIAELLRCDGIFMLPDWEKSKGARIELQLAKDLNIPLVQLL